MKIILTGGSGFIGSSLLKALRQRKVDLVLVSNHHPVTLNSAGSSSIDIIKADLLSESGRKKAVELAEADTLVHLAWYVDPVHFWQSPKNLDWLGASLDLIKIFAERGGKRIICLGSCSEYDWSAGGCFSEYSSPVSPSTFYGQTKDALRRAVQGYAAVKNLPFLWGRLFWPYGPGEAPERLLTSLARLMMAGQKAGCRAGNLKRDYIYIDDAAEALAAAICSNMEGILNIASGESVPLGYLAETLAEMLGLRHRLSIGSVPVSPGNPEEIKGDIRRLREELNWQPRFTIEAGLKVMADHLKR